MCRFDRNDDDHGHMDNGHIGKTTDEKINNYMPTGMT
jgi:hypothetical protein